MAIVFNDNRRSKGALAIRKEIRRLGYKTFKLKQHGSRYIPKPVDLVINWGTPSRHLSVNELNIDTKYAANKLLTFTKLQEIAVSHVFNHEDIPTDWALVYARTTVTSSKGRGIVIGTKEEVPKDCQLYTKATPADEYRVHIFCGEVLQVQKKIKMTAEQLAERNLQLNHLIKNHDNGWYFKTKDFIIPEGLEETAIEAVQRLGLDFGAVDMLYKFYPKVLEVNSAPAITGERINIYADAIIKRERIQNEI